MAVAKVAFMAGVVAGCSHGSGGSMSFSALAPSCDTLATPSNPSAIIQCDPQAETTGSIAQPAPMRPTTSPRSEVVAKLAALREPADFVGGKAPPNLSSLHLGAPTQPARPPAAPHAGMMRLTDSIAYAVMTYPEIRINEARLREAAAGINISESGLYPSADLRMASGSNFSGSYQGKALPYDTASNTLDKRFDGGLILRQLVYDFGATRSDIERATYLQDAERHKLREKIDEIASKTAQVFIKLHEQRSLLKLVDETIGSHENLLRIVMAQEKEGQGTAADVNRVKSRLVDVRAIRADVSLQMMSAEDQFERLTRHRPTRLGDVPNYRAIIPTSSTLAVSRVLANNPRLAAMAANNRAVEKELEFQKANVLPKLNLEVETESKNYRNPAIGRTQVEGRAMLAMRFRLLDGGLAAATERQIEARIQGGQLTLLNEREQLEADIRQAYRAIDSAQRKGKLVSEGVSSAINVRELYLEQFKAGKRTIFELLDGQMAYYTARRAQIESQYEGIRAVFDVLRSTGELTRTLAGAEPVGVKRQASPAKLAELKRPDPKNDQPKRDQPMPQKQAAAKSPEKGMVQAAMPAKTALQATPPKITTAPPASVKNAAPQILAPKVPPVVKAPETTASIGRLPAAKAAESKSPAAAAAEIKAPAAKATNIKVPETKSAAAPK